VRSTWLKFLLPLEFFLSFVLWNGFFDYGDHDNDALSLGGHFLLIVVVYIGTLKAFLGLVWFFTLLLSLVTQVKVVLAKAR
jgi:hypothetical protein